MINNLLSWSWNILQETLFSSGCVLQYSFYIGIFYLFEANRSQPKHFTASSSRYYIYIFTRGSLCLHQSRSVNNPG